MLQRLFVLIVTILATGASYADDFAPEQLGRHTEHRQRLKVFDARGAVVGLLAANGGDDGVYLRINGAVAFAPVRHWTNGGTFKPYLPSRFQWSESGAVFFESTDCTGSPAIGALISGIRPSVVVRTNVEAVLYVAGDTNASPVEVRSISMDSLCSRAAGARPLLRAEATFSLTQHYPEPLIIGY
ncbi:hypothetical protein [Caballeronia sp. SL2Y3]|uniref:hypothetical protein n=1 Tax=Caballeronia sp. SL2Y3 TaxID=2878151 RepID=UPI001FD004D5|nr:hypothetical protein [Caballeronia sp. SL2Y3]